MRLAIVTNQQGIGLGYSTLERFVAVNQRLFRELGPAGIRISRVYFCPHTAADRCACRKPGPGMAERALRDFPVPPGRAFFVGDSAADLESGAAAGCRTVLVGAAPAAACDYHATGFAAAADWILAQ
jgi:histidinol-phosphate phosphatase family protein